ncbi:Crooked neck-like protein [Arachis hypogaea]|nr:Crooked neck-like protein [Arachis hypogaea]
MSLSKEAEPTLGHLTLKDTEVKLPRPTRVKNKTPAPIQITAEQILREAREQAEIRPPKQKITDPTELGEYRLCKRKEFEDQIRRVRWNIGVWIKEGIEDAVVGKRRFQYEDEVRKNPLNYDSWFDYIRLEESVGNKERIREVYERAIANVPPAEEKRFWQLYIYLWINYALYEELDAEDVDPTRDVYRKCLNLIPHSKFSFAKIWLLAAQFEIRQLNLKGARQILGNAIGNAPKDKIFNKYIEIELQLGNIDRCRKLYEKYLEWSPENCYAWTKYAELERSLSETERARAIFELAIAQPALDMPELLWKAYIDFETAEFEAQNSLDLTEEEQKRECLQRARRVFEKALNYFRSSAPELKEERAMLLEKWLNMEAASGKLGDVSLVQSKLPKKLKKRRQVTTEDGSARIEEFIDYLFPEKIQTSNLKILAAAYQWKKKQKLSSGDN